METTAQARDLGLTHAQFSELIGAIYDCAVDTSRWEATLTEVIRVFDGQTAIVSLTDIRHDRLLINRSAGIEPYWQMKLEEHLPEITEQLGKAFTTWPSLDEPFIVRRHLPPEYFDQSRYCNEVLKPQGISDIMQYFLIGSPSRFAGFAVTKNERQGFIGPRDIELGRLLLPHIRRSVVISDLLDARTIEKERLTEVLDTLRAAVILVGQRGGILHANEAALQLLQQGDVLRDRSGVLQSPLPSASAELQRAIERAAHNESDIGAAGTAIRLTPIGSPPLFASVLPLTGGVARTRLSPAAAAAVLVGVPADERDSAHLVALAFDLTRAETRVLAELLSGKTLAEISAALNIAATTTRSHLDHIFSKTGVTRQAELVRLAMELSSPAHFNRASDQ
jgi:DNA-binding CsgD family transcriptional regulator/PAS domain-containing protein